MIEKHNKVWLKKAFGNPKRNSCIDQIEDVYNTISDFYAALAMSAAKYEKKIST